MLTLQPSPTETPHVRRDALPPVPALMLTGASAALEGNMGGLKCVAQVLTVLMDGAAQFTDADRELVRRLYQVACEDFGY